MRILPELLAVICVAIVAAPIGTGANDGVGRAEGCEYVPADVQLGFHISASDWSSVARIDDAVTIPHAKIIASKITTANSPGLYGTLNFETPVGGATPTTRVWISSTPGGPPLGPRCERGPVGFIYSLNWEQLEYRDCLLMTDAVYYVNMVHCSADMSSSVILRSLMKMSW